MQRKAAQAAWHCPSQLNLLPQLQQLHEQAFLGVSSILGHLHACSKSSTLAEQHRYQQFDDRRNSGATASTSRPSQPTASSRTHLTPPWSWTSSQRRVFSSQGQPAPRPDASAGLATAAAPSASAVLTAAAPEPALDDPDEALPQSAVEVAPQTGAPPPDPAGPLQLLQAVPTPEGVPADRLLVRDFIQNSLYHPTLGYFNRPNPPVGSVGSINYWKIYNKMEFKRLESQKYKELQDKFLTPAEMFSPHYGHCIARHMVEHRRHYLGTEGQPLDIVEVGGGNGTLARDILDWLRANRPAEYRLTSYTCLEISTSLASRQWDAVVTRGGHGGRFNLRRGSGLDPGVWGPRSWGHTFVLAMEVLDNLPHDRVSRARPGEPWRQSAIVPASPFPAATPTRGSHAASAPTHGTLPALASGPWLEVAEPLSDPLIARTLAAAYVPPSREDAMDERLNRVLDFILARDAAPRAAGGEEVVWLPTAAAAFLSLLHDRRPNHSLIAADFDRLPDVALPGRNAPLVAEKVGGRNIDHPTLLVPWGTADIFFPTDFDVLCRLYRATGEHVWGGRQGGQDGTAGKGAGGAGSEAAGSSAGAAGAGAVGGAGAAAAAGAAGSEVADAAAAAWDVGGEVNAEHFRQGAVLKRYREMFKTATICAFNPMVDDFVNARFFFGDAKGRLPPGQARPPPQQPSKTRLPPGAPAGGLAFGIKAHIPAASAASVRARSQAGQAQAQQRAEPVLGGQRQRLRGGGGGGGGGGLGGGGVDKDGQKGAGGGGGGRPGGRGGTGG